MWSPEQGRRRLRPPGPSHTLHDPGEDTFKGLEPRRTTLGRGYPEPRTRLVEELVGAPAAAERHGPAALPLPRWRRHRDLTTTYLRGCLGGSLRSRSLHPDCLPPGEGDDQTYDGQGETSAPEDTLRKTALLGIRLTTNVQQALSRPLSSRHFWTDNSCVRNWVRSTSSSYKIFVSHRIGEIQTFTSPEEWRLVPWRLNSSDLGSKLPTDSVPSTWFEGPDFLALPEQEWPPDLPWTTPTEELRKDVIHHLCGDLTPAVIDWQNVRFDPKKLPSLTVTTRTLFEMLKVCHRESFSPDIESLRKNGQVRRTSPLAALNPTIGEEGLLRVDGRIDGAVLAFENRHPVLLPTHHILTTRIVEAFHRRLLHVGVDFVLAHVRQHFWIVHGRQVVKRVGRLCELCTRERARPETQLMLEVPKERLAFYQAAFTNIAVDYFGPFYTSSGRGKTAKRYGASISATLRRSP